MEKMTDGKREIKVLNREQVLHSHRGYWVLRRGQDILFSGIGLVVLSPFFLLIAVLIYLDDPHGSPIFTQDRCGRDGKLFTIYKFRSMYADAEKRGKDLKASGQMEGPVLRIQNDPRITRVGSFLRKTSIDELPQLWNVFKGDMSIVGPRPALPSEVALYEEIWMQRMYVTPGLTCYWQVAPDRDEISFDDWMAMDMRYIEERSFWVDWKIIFMTVKAMAGKEGR